MDCGAIFHRDRCVRRRWNLCAPPPCYADSVCTDTVRASTLCWSHGAYVVPTGSKRQFPAILNKGYLMAECYGVFFGIFVILKITGVLSIVIFLLRFKSNSMQSNVQMSVKRPNWLFGIFSFVLIGSLGYFHLI